MTYGDIGYALSIYPSCKLTSSLHIIRNQAFAIIEMTLQNTPAAVNRVKLII